MAEQTTEALRALAALTRTVDISPEAWSIVAQTLAYSARGDYAEARAFRKEATSPTSGFDLPNDVSRALYALIPEGAKDGARSTAHRV